MEFRLIYEGPLPGQAGKAHHKWNIRRQLHPQLEALWSQEPLNASSQEWLGFPPSPNATSVVVPRGTARFAPLITSRLDLYAELSIILFRRQEKGALLLGDGDLDNRTKTLIDGLRIPRASQEFGQASQVGPLPDSFFCLLEDDSLVTKLSVESEQLLSPGNSTDVLAIVSVNVRKKRLTPKNISI